MKQKLIFILSILLMCVDSFSQKSVTVNYYGPDDIILDANTIRGQVGYTWADINNLSDSMEHRKAQLVDLRCEFMLISNAMDKYMNFVVFDALYTDIAFGKLTTKPLGTERAPDDPMREGKFSFAFKWGYDFYLGYRNKNWGLMGGIRPQWSMLSIGDFSSEANSGGLGFFTFDYPLAIRGEWRPFSHFEYRIIASAWTSVKAGMQTRGVKLELPTFPKSRYWVFVELASNNDQYLYLSTDAASAKRTTLFTAGIRFGSIF